MKIILANPRGFCAGVNMAIESLERALELYGTPLYVYHEIVHNRPIVKRFNNRGVIFVDGISEIPEGATVLYSAHGVAPAIREASAERLRASSLVRRTVLHILLTGHGTGSILLVPMICDRSLFQTSSLYFRMLRDASERVGRRAAATWLTTA